MGGIYHTFHTCKWSLPSDCRRMERQGSGCRAQRTGLAGHVQAALWIPPNGLYGAALRPQLLFCLRTQGPQQFCLLVCQVLEYPGNCANACWPVHAGNLGDQQAVSPLLCLLRRSLQINWLIWHSALSGSCSDFKAKEAESTVSNITRTAGLEAKDGHCVKVILIATTAEAWQSGSFRLCRRMVQP